MSSFSRRVAVGALVLAAACTGANEATRTTSHNSAADPSSPPSTPGEAPATPPTSVDAAASSCQAAGEAPPWSAEVSVSPQRLSVDGLVVHVFEYPLPDYEAKNWSQWGQGAILPDGRHVSAVGDEIGQDGNSYFYMTDLGTNAMTRIGDAQSVVGHEPGSWGYGKVHAQMAVDMCGTVLASTYWGSRRDLRFGGSYQGDHLVRIDPQDRTLADLGLILEGHGVPSMAVSPDGRWLYAEAVEPLPDVNTGPLVVMDTRDGGVVSVEEGTHDGFRSLAVDDAGRVYYTAGMGRLARLDPASGETVELDDPMPGEILRATTRPAADGAIYAVTRNPPVFFSLSPDGSIDSLGPADGYTTSIVLDHDDRTLYYVPYAHGAAWEHGAPILEFDVVTGEQRTLALLQPALEEELGLRLGGTYNVTLDAERRRLFIGMNASDEGGDGGAFGTVILLVIELA